MESCQLGSLSCHPHKTNTSDTGAAKQLVSKKNVVDRGQKSIASALIHSQKDPLSKYPHPRDTLSVSMLRSTGYILISRLSQRLSTSFAIMLGLMKVRFYTGVFLLDSILRWCSSPLSASRHLPSGETIKGRVRVNQSPLMAQEGAEINNQRAKSNNKSIVGAVYGKQNKLSIALPRLLKSTQLLNLASREILFSLGRMDPNSHKMVGGVAFGEYRHTFVCLGLVRGWGRGFDHGNI